MGSKAPDGNYLDKRIPDKGIFLRWESSNVQGIEGPVPHHERSIGGLLEDGARRA